MIAQSRTLADAFPPLLVAARQVAGAVMGTHGRRRAGPGDSFWQFRAARPGDPARLIDWRQSARSDHLQVRETEWAAAQTLHVWCDASPSLDWRSMPNVPKKSERALVMSLALALLALRAGERVCPLGQGAPVGGEHNLDRVALGLAAGGGTDPLSPIDPRHGLVLVSDFLKPVEHWQTIVKSLSGQGVRGHLLHVIDPAEELFPYGGRVRFLGMDDPAPLVTSRAQDLQAAYGDRMRAHNQALTELAQSLGWTHIVHRTDLPPQTALLALYVRLTERVR